MAKPWTSGECEHAKQMISFVASRLLMYFVLLCTEQVCFDGDGSLARTDFPPPSSVRAIPLPQRCEWPAEAGRSRVDRCHITVQPRRGGLHHGSPPVSQFHVGCIDALVFFRAFRGWREVGLLLLSSSLFWGVMLLAKSFGVCLYRKRITSSPEYCERFSRLYMTTSAEV